jgi:PD-(D/E)XK nuclease superfamily
LAEAALQGRGRPPLLTKHELTMTAAKRISAKTLGALALPGACGRCFWIQMRLEGRLPFQIFPGIFSTLDSYSKRIIQSWFDRHGGPPPWLAPIGEIARSIPPPHHSKFRVEDSETSILLTGTPDAVFQLADGSFAIVDYKTAKFTAAQDELFPMYEAQLNAYAFIGERHAFKPVSKLALVYTEPVADDAAVADENHVTEDGFTLGFSTKILPVETKPSLIPELLRVARGILDSPNPPEGASRCKDCAALERLLTLAAS